MSSLDFLSTRCAFIDIFYRNHNVSPFCGKVHSLSSGRKEIRVSANIAYDVRDNSTSPSKSKHRREQVVDVS